jgi:hypothetical protein
MWKVHLPEIWIKGVFNIDFDYDLKFRY